ncbi:MAG TPA: hypothetical protein VI542_23215 [Candidatus Tectomicrobia bacterium]
MPRNDLKAYTSLIARIPQDLADQVRRYAREHRCAVSELIRDGLEMRLEEGSPRQAHGDSRTPDGEVLHEVLHALEALTPLLRSQLQDTVRATMAEVLHEVIHKVLHEAVPRDGEVLQKVSHQDTGVDAGPGEVLQKVLPDDVEVLHEVLPSGDQVLHGHTSTFQAPPDAPGGGMTEVMQGHTEVIPQKPTARTASRGVTEVLPSQRPPAQLSREGITEVIPQQPPPAQPSAEGMTEVLPFDTTRYRLGKLCPRGHDYEGTGQSLRVNNKAGYCIACNVATKQRKRDQARQEVTP